MSIRGRTNASLSFLTRLEAEKESKLRVEEEKERLSLLGQSSDLKAKKYIEEDFKRNEKLEHQDFDRDIEQLQRLRNLNPKFYFRYLAQVVMKFAQQEGIPKKYRIDIQLTDKGILLKIIGTKYQGAFKPSGLPSYDRHACKILVVRLGNTIAKLEGYSMTTEGGVILPDEEDTRHYGRR